MRIWAVIAGTSFERALMVSKFSCVDFPELASVHLGFRRLPHSRATCSRLGEGLQPASAAINVAVATTPKDAPGTSTGGDPGTTVKGWFGVAPGQCATVSDNRATDIWFYIYVASNGGPIGGDSRLCVTQQPFKSGQQFLHQG
ncbi:MAG: DUF1036 domain-containing protein [Stellaceae bacterium]